MLRSVTDAFALSPVAVHSLCICFPMFATEIGFAMTVVWLPAGVPGRHDLASIPVAAQ